MSRIAQRSPKCVEHISPLPRWIAPQLTLLSERNPVSDGERLGERGKREARAEPKPLPRPTSALGRQIGCYVLQPYQIVKDLRTGRVSERPSTSLTATSIRSWRGRRPTVCRAGRRRSRMWDRRRPRLQT
jgi:hypothetical protein